ncbi:MAG: ABC transporter ATP-binding protein/permease [Epsilonproteobacteria bacterium]|nr:ABC transporter ATP-binding protein/permease [Campylobacterota bacterium]
MGKDSSLKDLQNLFFRFSHYFKDYKKRFVLMFIGMFMVAIGTMLIAYMIKPVLDKIFIEKNETLLYLVPFGLVAVYIIKSVGLYIQSYYATYIGEDMVRRLRDDSVRKILTFEMGFFHEFRSGELISRTVNDIERVRNVVSSMIPVMLREAMTIIVLLAYIFYLNPKMALISIVFIPLAFKPLSILAKKMKKFSKSSQEKISDLTARLSEIFNNVEMIKANAVEAYEMQRFAQENKNIFNVNMKAAKTNILVSPIMEIFGSLAAALVIILGGLEVIKGNMTVGSFFSFLTALFMLYTPVKRISNLYNKIQDAVAASDRIHTLLEREAKIIDGTKLLQDDIHHIEFKDITLYYEDKLALSNINFSVQKGEKIALVGNSGGGKSSIVNLLLRFYDVSSGALLIDGENINHFEQKSLRDSISIVTQRVYILHDSVAKNVAYGLDVDNEKVIQALKKANAWDFIEKLDNSIETIINEFGTNLSGGQRQRIAIARAIYREPKILIFDEATSALDTKSETKITDALEEISKDKITFIIAHRLNTIAQADQIVVLKEGKISCIGKNSELLKHCDEFMHLHGLQK